MGCCFSSNTTAPAAAAQSDPKFRNAPRIHYSPTKSSVPETFLTPPPPPPRPPPPPEEETVKEVLVLSETPAVHKKPQENAQMTLTEAPETEEKDSRSIEKQEQLQPVQEQETSDLTYVSEAYNVDTETISTTTATTTATKDIKEDEAMSKENKRVNHRSPAKVPRKRPYSADPASAVRTRRVESSPEKRARGRGRGTGEVRTMQRSVGSRSRSPATGRAGGVGRGAAGRSSPVKVAGKAGGRGRAVGAEQREESKEDGVSEQTANESLENPHVSLECFIFL